MNTHFTALPTGRALAAACALALCGSAMAAQHSVAKTISPAAYSRAESELKDVYRAEREACSQQAGNAKDICVETAKGHEKVALAHLQWQRTGKAADMSKLRQARYEARYEIAKEHCDDKNGNAKDVCMLEAKAQRDKAEAAAKTAKDMAEDREQAQDTAMKADYKVAREKCDALSGDAKDSCQAAARARYGQ